MDVYLKVFGSLRRLTTERRTVLTFWVGFHLSHASSPLWGSSTGGCSIDIHRSPFLIEIEIYLTINILEKDGWVMTKNNFVLNKVRRRVELM